MAFGIAAALQIFDDVLDAPGFQPAACRGIEPGCEPAIHSPASKGAAPPVLAKDILGRVTNPAMADTFDQVAAAIPVWALLLVRFEDTGLEKKEIPHSHEHAKVQREAQAWLRRFVLIRPKGREIGADRKNVVAREFREIGVWEGRIIARAVGRHAIA